MKRLSDDQLGEMALKISQMDADAGQLWSMALAGGIPITSPLYRQICATGHKVQDLYHALLSEAEGRKWTGEQIKAVFTKTKGYSYR